MLVFLKHEGPKIIYCHPSMCQRGSLLNVENAEFISSSVFPHGCTGGNLRKRMGEGMLTMLVSGSGCVQCQPVAPGHPGDGQHLLRVLRGQQAVHHPPGGGAQCPHECH